MIHFTSRQLCLLFFLLMTQCVTDKSNRPVVGFLDLLPDETLEQAKKGFFDALKQNGFEDGKTINVIYRNAQNDQPALLQACDYMISQKPELIATNPTLSTIIAVQRTKNIPVFMMVSPRPDLAGLTDKSGNAPSNLFGVYETLDYIDTSLMLIREVIPSAKRIGVIYNQSEPQSVDALNEIKKACEKTGLELISMPVSNSNETQLIVQSILTKKIDAFFALPDNIVFSSMEVIVKSCDDVNVPVFTSEEGLVKRGALAAFGADMYQWGFQSGQQASEFLKTKSTSSLRPEIVSIRRRVYNKSKAAKFNVHFDNSFSEVK